MLLYKHQIGMVMGKKGSTINEVRNKSSATIKLVSPANGVPIVPCALPDDEMVTVSAGVDAVCVFKQSCASAAAKNCRHHGMWNGTSLA